MAKHNFVDVDTTDDFLDYPLLRYAEPDGSSSPVFTDEELSRIGKVTGTKMQVPSSPDR